MVKFGRHLQFYIDCENLNSHYIVPYDTLRDKITPHPQSEQSQEDFKATWREVLEEASRDFSKSTHSCWQTVFEGVSPIPQARGASLETALRLYTPTVGTTASQDLLVFLKGIHSAAEVNSEALRKAVKKFDKQSNRSLSDILLPELYCSIVAVGQSSVKMAIDVIRDLLDCADDTGVSKQYSHIQSDSWNEDEALTRRADELQCLTNFTSRISPEDMPYVVAHRGFHDPHGRSEIRPLENSLAAFEAAWSSGINLCECDVALTRDEKIVMAHDDDFFRLALDPSSDHSKEKVQNLTYKELIALTLKNGVRTPLLLDVLRSAQAIGKNAQLVVEIKPGNKEVFRAVARLLIQYPDLITHVAVIMSYDLWAMHEIRSKLTLEMNTGRHSNIELNTYPDQQNSNNIVEEENQKVSSMLPSFILLTATDPPVDNYQLWLDISDLSPVKGWLEKSDGSLDGIYMRYQPEMMEPEGRTALKQLTKSYKVGIWGLLGKDPDNNETMQYLIRECGISFFNTDIPKDF